MLEVYILLFVSWFLARNYTTITICILHALPMKKEPEMIMNYWKEHTSIPAKIEKENAWDIKLFHWKAEGNVRFLATLNRGGMCKQHVPNPHLTLFILTPHKLAATPAWVMNLYQHPPSFSLIIFHYLSLSRVK